MSCVVFFKQKTAYEMRISDWSSDVCSSDLGRGPHRADISARAAARRRLILTRGKRQRARRGTSDAKQLGSEFLQHGVILSGVVTEPSHHPRGDSLSAIWGSCVTRLRSEEHTSELQSLMRISYAVFCLKKKIHTTQYKNQHTKVHN